jgi:hypothetical protein
VFALYQNLRDREKVLVLLAFVSLLIALFSMQSERGNMETVFGGISALAAVGAAFVAWWAIRAQDQRARLTLSVNLINQYIDAFESDRIRTARRNAAEFIVRATTQEGKFKWSLSDDDSELEDLRKVLNLFDHLGTLVRSGAIDERYVWNAFFPMVQMYWLGAKPMVEYWRENTHRRFILEDAEYLNKTLSDYEKQQLVRINSPGGASPSWKEIREFLSGESELSV